MVHVKNSLFLFVIIIIIIFALLSYWICIDVNNGDLRNYAIPWFKQLLERGHAALSGEFSNYTPPYLYLLWIVTPLHALLSDIRLIKLVSIFFNFVSAGIVAYIVMQVTQNYNRGVLAGACFLVLPTVVINSSFWGQSDIIYTSFVLLSVLSTIEKKETNAIVFFAISLSFKLQAILIAPYFLYRFMKCGISIYHVAIIPFVYCIMMLPSWFMGRSALQLAQIYINQFQYYRSLSMNAPNLYSVVQNFDILNYSTGVMIGSVISVITAIMIAVWGSRRITDDSYGRLMIFTTSSIIMPFVLPKMHERYFFLADVLTYVLAFVMPNTWPLALTMQIASVSAYAGYFGWNFGPYFGAMAASMAVAGIIFVNYRNQAAPGRGAAHFSPICPRG